ncbi:lantibiotic synthetase protein [Streptococcus dysgalactiae subsp. dysgalactiae ATCC 27957]|nr:lantibiotic synthetase protein [Streptococcus dysgalactiae subsp. dysgalactiae ATCC 27957]
MQYDFSIQDPLFFTFNDDVLTDFSSKYSAPLPYDWHELSNNSEWVNQYPIGYSIDRQGWKVHISSDYKHSHEVLEIVSKVCHEFRVVFKYLKTEKVFILRNGKNIDRGYSGKFVTCYPNIEILEQFLIELESRLKGYSGPYILSDRRWKEAPIYLRYGVFRESIPEIEGNLKSDELLVAGKIIKDIRAPQFVLPEGIEVPDFLKEWLKDIREETSNEFPFSIESAIRFSNCGGIYNATLNSSNKKIILRESRPYTGLDFSGEYSSERMEFEKKALTMLKDIDGIPNVLWSGKLWEHDFLGVEKMDGIPLNNWLTNNYPLYDCYGKEKYLYRAKNILEQLVSIVEEAHKKGVYHQDIHFGNILVNSGDKVSLIDWEQARFDNTRIVEQKMAAPGYGSWIEDYPSKIDWYGVKQIAHYLYLPLIEQTALVLGYDQQTFKVAHRNFVNMGYSDIDIRKMEDIIISLDNRCSKFDNLSEKKILKPCLNNLAINSEVEVKKFASKLGRGLLVVSDEWKKKYNKRIFPVHYYGLKINQGMAFSDLAILFSYKKLMDLLSEEIDEGYEKLKSSVIQSAIEEFQESDPGLFDGISGTIWIIYELGEEQLAIDLFNKYYSEMISKSPRKNIYSGTAGILLVGLYLVSQHSNLLVKELVLSDLNSFADEYLLDPAKYCIVGTGGTNSNDPYETDSGLLFGHIGLGWLFGEAYRYIRDSKYLDCLNLAIESELVAYEKDASDRLQYNQGERLLPYLSTGSGGLLLLISRNKKFLNHSILNNYNYLEKAVSPRFCVFPGMFNGLCGLFLSRNLYKSNVNFVQKCKELIEYLETYLCVVEDGFALAGDSGLKLTTDISTGTAGIILTLVSLRNGKFELLPSIQKSKR